MTFSPSKSIPHRPSPRRLGLTLVEVIIVLAILLVLITMLLPAINQSRESARRTKCAHNIRQIGINHTANNRTVLYTICPSDPEAESRTARDGTSFIQNLAIRRKKNQMAYSKTIIYLEAAVGVESTSIDPTPWYQPTNSSDTIWAFLQDTVAMKRHTGNVANYLYADGHVVAIPESHIRTWNDQRVPFLLINEATYAP